MLADSTRGRQQNVDDTSAGAVEPTVELTALKAHVDTPNADAPNVASQNDGATGQALATKKITESSELDLRHQVIHALFGLKATYTESWSGTLVFCTHLEKCFQDLLNDSFDIIWVLLGRPKPQRSFEVWHWCLAVLKALQHKTSSLENTYRLILEQSSISSNEIDALGKTRALQAIFAVICWMSLTLEPNLLGDTPSATPHLDLLSTSTWRGKGYTQSVSLKQFSTRPINKLFRGFDKSPADTGEERTSDTPSTGTIYESSINFDSLYTIGRLRVKWSNTIAAHLSWNREDHTVSIFRFPTFSAATIQGLDRVSTMAEVQAELLPSESYVDMPQQSDPRPLHRELMLSYRLLFGQSSRSRKLVRDLLVEEKKANREVDPLLEKLCTLPLSGSWAAKLLSRGKHLVLPAEIFPQSTISASNVFMESGSYSVEHEFSVFGSRLLELQKYNLRQRPSRARDLWRDRRNPLQWYTFWAVIWVGGITIILAVLQLCVGIAQLYFAPGSS